MPSCVNDQCFPELYNFSASWFFKFLPVPHSPPPPPEYVRIPVVGKGARWQDDAALRLETFAMTWNLAWEAGHFRAELFRDDIPPPLRWLERFPDKNFYFVPAWGQSMYPDYGPLYHLLPYRRVVEAQLPVLERGIWPREPLARRHDSLPRALLPKLSKAVARHLWPHLCSRPGTSVDAFGERDSLRLLAHNLDFWMPYVDAVARQRLSQFPRTKVDDADLAIWRDGQAAAVADRAPFQIVPPLKGGAVWLGAEDAADATRRVVELADAQYRLRSIFELLEHHRVADDFSSRWSVAKSEFERRLYRKRNRVAVSFVELDETIPVHGDGVEVEVDRNLFWQDLMAVADLKQRRILVLLRSGHTHGEIAKELGYANHSPVSKALLRICAKARRLFDA